MDNWSQIDLANKPLLILEAGVNHEGDFDEAIALVDSAARAGADFVKFQSYSASTLAAPNSPSYWDLSEEPTKSQRELFSRYDTFKVNDYQKLAQRAKQQGIGFLTTCFDEQWVRELDSVLPFYKVASADLTNFSLLKVMAQTGKPLLLSTGAAKFSEIQSAISFLIDNGVNSIALMHCVLNYPCPPENAHLSRLQHLGEVFPNVALGYSDHTKPADSFTAIQLAFTLGARIFEKHFTLDKKAKGNDHYHSFDENDVLDLRRQLAYTNSLLSFDEERFVDDQKNARLYARRGLYARTKLEKGERITPEKLIALRPTLGEYGYGGDEIFELSGKIVSKPIEALQPVLRNDLNDL